MSLYSSLTQILAPFAAKINGLLTGWDGTKYSTPGEAVRTQISDLHVLIGDVPGVGISGSAVSYDGTESGVTATNMQGAVDELSSNVDDTNERLDDLSGDLDSYVLSKFTSVKPTNWYNPTGVTTGYIVKANGTIEEQSGRCYTDYIPVNEGDEVRLYKGQSSFPTLYRTNICLYDAEKNVVSGGSNSTSSAQFTIPAGVSYIRISMASTNILESVKLMITLDGLTPTEYSAYFEPYEVLTENFLDEESERAVSNLVAKNLARSDLANRYACAVPRRKLRMTLELQQPWYIRSLVYPSNAHIQVGCGASNYKRYADRIEFVRSSAGGSVNGYRFMMYDEIFGKMLMSDVTYAPAGYGQEYAFVAENLSDCSLLAIGDSTVDQDTMTAKILQHFTEKEHTITLLGTLGSGLNKNEGRAGWKATDYLTNRQYGNVVNPFYNPTTETFDFAYYMTNEGYSAPDFVVIQLGINDLYNLSYADVPTAIPGTWNAIKTMIDSILAYNSGIKIILNLPTTPNSDISLHSNFLPLYENTRIMYNDYAQEQARKYSTAQVRVSYCHLILDADSDIGDTVHPNTTGYTKMANEVISQINVWQNDA